MPDTAHLAGPPPHPAGRFASRLVAGAEARPTLALLLLCLALWLPGFAALPPGDRDESRFAQATRQMLDTGDYVRIRFGEEERNKKPAGIHWAQAAAVQLAEATGIATRAQIWPYRVPSLLGGLIAVLATFHLGRGLVGRRPALLGAAMLAGSVLLVVEVHIAKTDAALLATITVAMGLFARAYLRPESFSARAAAGFWLVLGLGVLLKGPIAPMVPLLSGITLAFSDRRSNSWWPRAPWLAALRPAWGVPLMLAAAAPWFIAIGLATEGRFFTQAIGGDMLGKVGAGEEKHWGPPGYYLLTFFIAGFPGAWIALCALPAAWRDRMNPATRFLLAWIVPSWLLFEAVQTKLPHYVLPCFPALMLLGAAWAMDPLRRRPPPWMRWSGLAGVSGVALGLAGGAGALAWQLEGRALPAALLALAAALALGVLVWRAGARRDYGRAALAGLLLAVPLYGAVLQGVLPRLQPLWIAPRLAAVLAQRAPGLAPGDFGATSYAEPSLVFAVGAGTQLLRDGPAAAAFLAAGPGRVVAVGDRAEAAFRQALTAQGLAVEELGTVSGINYTNGRGLTLVLYRRPAG